MRVTEYCRTIPDYPIEGINFYDLNSVFSSIFFSKMIRLLKRRIDENYITNPTHIVGVESRGFVVGSALAHEMELPFTMVRKASAKYPGNVKQESYNLEYGSNNIVLQEGILGHTSRVIIVDDLIATGGTLLASQRLCNAFGAKVLANVALLDLEYIVTPEKKELNNIIVLESVKHG